MYFFFFFLISCWNIAYAQNPDLIFHSGFEPNTDTALQSSLGADIIGADNSVSPPNDWQNHLENHPSIGVFNIQYQGGNDTMRLAEIVPDPVNPSNKVLNFRIRYPNVPVTAIKNKGRVQANLYGNTGIKNLFYSIKLFLPYDLDTLKYVPTSWSWFTLMEFWNNPNWTGDTYPFRISVNLSKPTAFEDSLRLSVHGQTYNYQDSTWTSVWEYTNMSFEVPIARWMRFKIYFTEGDSSTGKFMLSVTPEGAPETIVFDITGYTHHPADTAPDGLSHFNPFKLYTSEELINFLRTYNRLTSVYWDDFEIWLDSTLTTNFQEPFLQKKVEVYYNLESRKILLRFPQKGIYTLNVYNLQGQEIASYPGINSSRFVLSMKDFGSGVYYFKALSGEKSYTGRFVIK